MEKSVVRTTIGEAPATSLRGDGVGYYALVRAPLIQHNFDFTEDYRHANLLRASRAPLIWFSFSCKKSVMPDLANA